MIRKSDINTKLMHLLESLSGFMKVNLPNSFHWKTAKFKFMKRNVLLHIVYHMSI